LAKVAELVDAHDSKSCIFGCAGSIPAFGTKSQVVMACVFFAVNFALAPGTPLATKGGLKKDSQLIL
jgi:hypothetical protein